MKPRKLPLTGLVVGSVSQHVLVCGDPGRATKIATRLADCQLLSDQREYRSYQGIFRENKVTVCSHGIGAPGAAIAFEELIAAGAANLIRIGTCGSLQPGIESGHLIIATAAVQYSGYGRETVPEGYPAVADLDLSLALREAAEEQAWPYQFGIVLTRDSFYSGVATASLPDYAALSSANVLAVEMECAALFIVGSLRGVRTAAILAVDGYVLETAESMDTYNPHQKQVTAAVDTAIGIALQALTRPEFGDSSPTG
jgi:uridine phosphorylase